MYIYIPAPSRLPWGPRDSVARDGDRAGDTMGDDAALDAGEDSADTGDTALAGVLPPAQDPAPAPAPPPAAAPGVLGQAHVAPMFTLSGMPFEGEGEYAWGSHTSICGTTRRTRRDSNEHIGCRSVREERVGCAQPPKVGQHTHFHDRLYWCTKVRGSYSVASGRYSTAWELG
jgi:hypothetical protein